MLNARSVKAELERHANPAKAAVLARFFKTGKGEYGEGDHFLGVIIPIQRDIARKHRGMDLDEITKLIKDKYHEVRMTGFLILVDMFERTDPDRTQYDLKNRVHGDEALREKIVKFYMKNLMHVNNWDFVDGTAPYILGPYYMNHSRVPIHKLARSKDLWRRRVGILAAGYFIRHNDFADILRIAKQNISDDRDLIQKATGWMLREVGKKDRKVLIGFLKAHAHHMPRTMLRYSLEHFSKEERKKYM